MTPYYDDGQCVIYHGDCREILPRLDPVDLVLTDPPYGIGDAPNTHSHDGEKRKGGRQGRINTWHPPSDWDKHIDSAWGPMVAAATNTVVWFGHWRKRAELETIIPLPLRCEVVWAKDMHCGPPSPLAPRDERIWVFSLKGVNGRHFETTVWDEPVIPTWSYKHHKNEKPLGLIRRLLRWISDPGQTALDPFMGSGTTLRAAKDLGRKAIGIELEEKYCEIAAKRLVQGALPLFDIPEAPHE